MSRGLHRRPFRLGTLLLIALLAASPANSDTVTYKYRVIESFPHSTDVFTQGLAFQDNRLYESAGMYGESRVLIRTLSAATPVQQRLLDRNLFAEGITILGDSIYQLTWKSRRGFIYNKESLEQTGKFRIQGEGWGITHNGEQLIISDGSSQLSFLDPASFDVVKKLDVRFEGKPVQSLNELEWINGQIYANIWGSNWIVMIDPNSGEVTGKVRLEHLLPDNLRTPHTDVLNGIAYDAAGQRLLVTGKYWPRLYHIELIAPEPAP